MALFRLMPLGLPIALLAAGALARDISTGVCNRMVSASTALFRLPEVRGLPMLSWNKKVVVLVKRVAPPRVGFEWELRYPRSSSFVLETSATTFPTQDEARAAGDRALESKISNAG